MRPITLKIYEKYRKFSGKLIIDPINYKKPEWSECNDWIIIHTLTLEHTRTFKEPELT